MIKTLLLSAALTSLAMSASAFNLEERAVVADSEEKISELISHNFATVQQSVDGLKPLFANTEDYDAFVKNQRSEEISEIWNKHLIVDSDEVRIHDVKKQDVVSPRSQVWQVKGEVKSRVTNSQGSRPVTETFSMSLVNSGDGYFVEDVSFSPKYKDQSTNDVSDFASEAVPYLMSLYASQADSDITRSLFDTEKSHQSFVTALKDAGYFDKRNPILDFDVEEVKEIGEPGQPKQWLVSGLTQSVEKRFGSHDLRPLKVVIVETEQGYGVKSVASDISVNL